uniref:PNPLA domain-containing protein n=1 Tax=Podospora anserina (strain S / ATCC MYA-4624 / DSM 980 / FGSC 10383) TaxID=515849 RepID=A0A090CLL5_PODAN|nr:Putative protein of unknown function [Podospora anserina S mat+]
MSKLRSGNSDKPILLTNYNVTGPEREKFRLNYEILRSANPQNEIKVWEAALTTSAAPPYFKPYVQPATGKSFVDGGLHYNCPAWVAHHERQILWKNVQYQQPDVLLSLGTGLGTSKDAVTTQVPQPTKKGFRNLVNIILGMVQGQLNSEKAWDDYYAHVAMTDNPEDRARYISLNVMFDIRPGLDKVDQLDLLETTTRLSARGSLELKDAADRLIASSFCLEREGPVIKGRVCKGMCWLSHCFPYHHTLRDTPILQLDLCRRFRRVP